MADSRHKFNAMLKDITENVYFSKGDGLKVTYPCIVYSRSYPDVKRANNHLYLFKDNYKVTFMSNKVSDTVIKKMLEKFPHASYDNSFTSEGINHETFTIYF